LSFYCAFSNHINFILLGFKAKKTLPIYNPADVNPELVDSTVQYISKYHTIADFHLPIKTGKPSPRKITKAKYMLLIFLHNVWFYLSKMTTNLSDIQKSSPIIQK
jgi:protein SCO1/2